MHAGVSRPGCSKTNQLHAREMDAGNKFFKEAPFFFLCAFFPNTRGNCGKRQPGDFFYYL
jgi:hypothetical protein